MFDPSTFLRDKSKFKNFDAEGMPLCSDASHLSKFGSRYIIKKIAPQILRELQR